jgi:hypothetical protein
MTEKLATERWANFAAVPEQDSRVFEMAKDRK